MLKYFEPTKLFSITSKAPKYVSILFIIVLTVGLIESLIFSPEDYKQSDSVRIMYVHVPAAWLSLSIFSVMTILSLLNYIFKIKNFKIFNKCLAPIGLLFSATAVITGSIWGKPTWGAWWVWDARLTSMIFLMLLYLIFIITLKFIKKDNLALMIISILSLIGVVNLFIIKYSVEWWNTLHQGPTLLKFAWPSMHSNMLWPLLIMMIAFASYCASMIITTYLNQYPKAIQ